MAKQYKRTSSKAWLKKAAVKPDSRGYKGFGCLHEIDFTPERAAGCDGYRLHMDYKPDMTPPAPDMNRFHPWERVTQWQWTEAAGKYGPVDEVMPSPDDLLYSSAGTVTVPASQFIEVLKGLKAVAANDRDAVRIYTETITAVNSVQFNVRVKSAPPYGNDATWHVMPGRSACGPMFSWYGRRAYLLDAVSGMRHVDDQVTLFYNNDRLIITPGAWDNVRNRDRAALIMAMHES